MLPFYDVRNMDTEIPRSIKEIFHTNLGANSKKQELSYPNLQKGVHTREMGVYIILLRGESWTATISLS